MHKRLKRNGGKLLLCFLSLLVTSRNSMNPDDFEQHLARQTLRPIPMDWRQEIVAAQTQPRSTGAATTWWRELLWPHPYAWSGLAAVWLIIFAMHFSAREKPNPAYAKLESIPPKILFALIESQRSMASGTGNSC